MGNIFVTILSAEARIFDHKYSIISKLRKMHITKRKKNIIIQPVAAYEW